MSEEKKDVKSTQEAEAARKLKDKELEQVVGGIRILRPKTY